MRRRSGHSWPCCHCSWTKSGGRSNVSRPKLGSKYHRFDQPADISVKIARSYLLKASKHPRLKKACRRGSYVPLPKQDGNQSQQLYRHECSSFPASTGLGSQKYIAYIPQKSLHPRPGYLNGVTMGFSGQGWPRYSEGASYNEAYVAVRLHQSDSGCESNFHSEPVAGFLVSRRRSAQRKDRGI